MVDDELELMNRAVAGDEACLQRLLMRHHRRLARHLATKIPAPLQSTISVDDVLQDAYLTVFRRISTFVPRGSNSFHSWLVRICENRLIDVIKAEKTAKRGGGWARIQDQPAGKGSAVEWLEILAVHERTPSRSLAGREAVDRAMKAMGSLKPDYQEALRLRYIEGLPVAETAARMERTEGAVCLLCHRALKQLEGLLGPASELWSRPG